MYWMTPSEFARRHALFEVFALASFCLFFRIVYNSQRKSVNEQWDV